MTRIDPPGAVRWIVRTLEDAGFESWAVGGAVRDALLGRSSSDWDLTTRAEPKQMRRLFRRTVPIGIDHGTVGILDRSGVMYEVTTFRRDVETTGRHAVVAFADTLREDLARRDFTINAVAWHPLEERIFDPFGGVTDLEQRVLRTVGSPTDRFAEDYLRVLRALRFAGRFRLRVEPDTWRALCRAVPSMGGLSVERIREELEKVLGGREAPSASLALYAASGALGFLYPELDRTIGRSHRPDWLPGGSGEPVGLWGATLRAVDLLPPGRWELRMAALLHGIGAVPADGFEGDPAGASASASERERATLRALGVMSRLRASNARIEAVAGWVGAVVESPSTDADPVTLRRWLRTIGRSDAPGALRLLGGLHRAYGLGGPHGTAEVGEVAKLLRRCRRELRSGAPLSERELAIGGRDLIGMGYRPGPEFGEVFEMLLDRVLEDPARNEGEGLLAEASRFLDQRDTADE